MIPSDYRDEPLEIMDIVAGLLWYAVVGVVTVTVLLVGAVLFMSLR
jgi:hypothetical protein